MSLSKKREELMRRFRELAKSPGQIVPATVKAVNEQELSCELELFDETELLEVSLKAGIDGVHDGIVQIPRAGSVVLAAMIGDNVGRRFVVACSEVEKVVFYGGSNEGLVNIVPLCARLNAIENKVNSLISYINGHTHPGNGSPPTPGYTGGELEQTSKEELEDTKVLH